MGTIYAVCSKFFFFFLSTKEKEDVGKLKIIVVITEHL